MEIGSITSMNSMSGMQMTMAGSADSKNKSIQKEITVAQQQMQALSSKEELSVNEKTKERNKLHQKISGLNTELKQHQEEFRKSQRREIMMAELLEDKKPANETTSDAKEQTAASLDKTDETSKKAIAEKGTKTLDSDMGTNTGLSGKESSTAVSADTSAQQADRPGTVIASTSDGIVILKEAMKQDEKRGIDAEKKQSADTSLNKTGEKNLPADRLRTEDTKEESIADKEAKTSDNDVDTGLSYKEMHELVSAENSVQQSNRQETIIAKISDGIVILKGEMNRDEKNGIDTETKQTELEKMEQREQRARAFQSFVLGESNNTIKSAEKTASPETQNWVR